MANPILKEVTVPIPEDGNVVIRNGKRVEYQLDRVYSPETKDSRVVRRVIGKVDPVQPGRMFPNELYFELFPDNEVPEEIRDEFLRDCAIKRDMGVIRQNPEEIVDKVVRGLDMLSQDGWAGEDGANRPIRIGPASSVPTGPSVPAGPGPTGPASSVPTGPSVPAGPGSTGPASSVPTGPSVPGETEKDIKYVMIRRVFDEIYFAIEELAGKFPNEVIDPYKVERINEVLEEMRDWAGIGVERRMGRWGQGNPAHPVGGPVSPVPAGPYLRLIEEGLTYSDVLVMMKWYKVLPR